MAEMKRAARTKKGHWITDCGEAVTPDVEERWAREIDRGFELNLWKRVRVGRPREGEPVWGRISTRVPPAVNVAVESRAAREGRTVANLAAAAIKSYVES